MGSRETRREKKRSETLISGEYIQNAEQTNSTIWQRIKKSNDGE